MIEKSANQLWRESKTTLSFKQWLNREKRKYVNFNGDGKTNVMMVNKPLNDTIKQTLSDIKKDVGYQTKASGKSTFGVSNTVIILIGVGALAFVTYKFIKARQK